jgi:iron complex transport system permease protein
MKRARAMNSRSMALSLLIALILASAVLVGVGMGVGSTGWSSAYTAFETLFSSTGAVDTASQVVWDIRLPRTLGAWLAGALLGLSGALAQGLFRNPLADPYLLGSASGASLGVALALLATGGSALTGAWAARLGVTGAAFIGAVFAVGLTMLLARGLGHTLRLLLAGVVVGVVLGAATSLLTLMAPEILQSMQSFMLGSTALVGWQACGVMLIVLAPSLLVAMSLARGLDALSLGEVGAKSLGFNLNTLRTVLVLVLALCTAAAVAQTGLIAFVGLAAPHATRSLLTVSYRRLLLLSALLGAVLLTAADIAARWLMAPQELPVGVVTALLGGTYLLCLMHRQHSALHPSQIES